MMQRPIDYPKKNANALTICIPRWKDWTHKSKLDPCGGCPLYEPCVRACPRASGLEPYVRWVENINRLADSLTEQKTEQ